MNSLMPHASYTYVGVYTCLGSSPRPHFAKRADCARDERGGQLRRAVRPRHSERCLEAGAQAFGSAPLWVCSVRCVLVVLPVACALRNKAPHDFQSVQVVCARPESIQIRSAAAALGRARSGGRMTASLGRSSIPEATLTILRVSTHPRETHGARLTGVNDLMVYMSANGLSGFIPVTTTGRVRLSGERSSMDIMAYKHMMKDKTICRRLRARQLASRRREANDTHRSSCRSHLSVPDACDVWDDG
jgi:hypothetical protein